MLFVNACVLLILDFYIFFALRATKIKFPKTKVFSILWWSYSVLLLLGVFISAQYNIPLIVRSVILVAFFLTAASKIFFFLILLIDDIRRGGVWLKRLFAKKRSVEDLVEDAGEPLPENPVKGISRSEFLTKAGILVGASPLIPLSWGIISGAYDYRVRRVPLYLPNLPKAFHGMTIAQISDVHSGSFYNKKAVTGGIDMLLKEKADVTFFTGDIVNAQASEMRDYQDIFARVKSDLGVFSTLGNHDYGDYYYGKEDSPAKRKNLQDVIDVHKVMGWDLLMDENRKIKVDGEELCIVGVQNWGTGRFPKHGDIKKALMGTEEQPVKLLLSHDPSHWRAQVLDTDVDVMFAGHTHGMQFGVRSEMLQWSPVQYIYKEWAGLYREQQNKRLYVNVGYGFLGYPVSQAADISIFKADLVPVGEDQIPHIELARKIVRRFNDLYKPVLIEPKELVGDVPRLIGLDGKAKMSKSLNNAIFLVDTPEEVKQKVWNSVTDPSRIRKTDPGHPDVCTVYEYHKVFNKDEVAELEDSCRKGEIGCVNCKKKLTNKINELLDPMRERRQKYINNPSLVKDILMAGTEKAHSVAKETMVEVRDAMKINYFDVL